MAAPTLQPFAPLPQRLRDDTRELHTAVERSGVMALLLRGQLGREGYVALLRNLHALYAALEARLAVQGFHPLLAPFPLAALRRAPALAADLDTLAGPRWREQLALVPAALAYAQRLQQAPAEALLAHAYVRYLGDLSGGQVLARLVGGRFGRGATRFYDFGPDERVHALRSGFRSALAALPAGPSMRDAVVAEACWAFAQHERLFEELASA